MKLSLERPPHSDCVFTPSRIKIHYVSFLLAGLKIRPTSLSLSLSLFLSLFPIIHIIPALVCVERLWGGPMWYSRPIPSEIQHPAVPSVGLCRGATQTKGQGQPGGFCQPCGHRWQSTAQMAQAFQGGQARKHTTWSGFSWALESQYLKNSQRWQLLYSVCAAIFVFILILHVLFLLFFGFLLLAGSINVETVLAAWNLKAGQIQDFLNHLMSPSDFQVSLFGFEWETHI